jgi:hypothetical protein
VIIKVDGVLLESIYEDASLFVIDGFGVIRRAKMAVLQVDPALAGEELKRVNFSRRRSQTLIRFSVFLDPQDVVSALGERDSSVGNFFFGFPNYGHGLNLL